jgi:tetratricopeptide (TPR) repeat protein
MKVVTLKKIVLIFGLLVLPAPLFWLFANKAVDSGTFFMCALISLALVVANLWDIQHSKKTGALSLVNQARELIEKGQMHAAGEKLDQALKLDKDCFEVRVARGEMHSQNRDFEKARRALLEALDIKKDSFRAHFALGTCYLNEQKLFEAVSEFRQTIQLKPDFSEAHFILAQAYELTGEKDKALDAYKKFLEIVQGGMDHGAKMGKYIERAQERVKTLK